MTTTLTMPEKTAREDGISGYAVTLMGSKETSNREPVEIVTYVDDYTIQIGIDRVVELTATETTNRVVVYSERHTEMITFPLKMKAGDTATLYPIDHPEAPPNAAKVNFS